METEMDTAAMPGAETLRRSVDILFGILLIGVGASVLTNGVQKFLVLGLLFGFAAVYYWGTFFLDNAPTWPVFVWLMVLTVLWVVMLPIQPLAVYLVFPLFFLYLNAFPDYRGITAVIGATVVAIFGNYPQFSPGSVVGPVLAALVTIAIFFAFRRLWLAHLDREQLFRELLATRHQLATTERKAGMVAERQRIAHEIHDTLAQGLSSIQMLLHVAEQEVSSGDADNAIKHIGLARTTAADNLSEARAMIAALQPAALEQASLEGALHRIAESSAVPEVAVTVEGASRPLPMRVEATLLRIAQGAMGNVEKHSGAGRAKLTLTFEPDEVRLDVVDHGAGFNPEEVSERPAGLGHIGLAAMHSRAAEVGGDLTVESTPGLGTAVSVAIPTVDSDA
ncbi:Sensor histidine kinase LiaS [Corynebacterium kalinowskii]|uniref:Sensor histidine kinase LiaS n=1 Tax=Corynebacterium kalinowskii TaxID=2675216 RepID=A0A6B8VW48_9CORY|nr:sensor histidine kinase [Corynebacterium kalinowskii]QGU03155.1 Sensor histidine kinase LiaS [Corynebacterium kalinowskii]